VTISGDQWFGYSFAPTKLVKTSRPLVMTDRSVMVDTNYLVLVNGEDLVGMFFDREYENKVGSTTKKQMARLFRDVTDRKLDLCFSNFIMREFIGLVPGRQGLLEIYRRYIAVNEPKDSLEPRFLDLAAAINALLARSGRAGDIKDTYSYILATLGNIRYFVTDDKDVQPLYDLICRIRRKDHHEIASEIRAICYTFGLLSNAQEAEFPIKDILGFLLLGPRDPTIPVSIGELRDHLPDVLTRAETILWMHESLEEIEWMRKSVASMPSDWNEKLLEQARSRISNIAHQIGLEDGAGIDADALRIRLIEKEASWNELPKDRDLASALSQQLESLRQLLYESDIEDGFDSFEEKFRAEQPIKEFRVLCENCDKDLVLEAEYQGVVDVEQRDMGPELLHEWLADDKCASCGKRVELRYQYWEYPLFMFNYEDTTCHGCRIVPKTATESGTTLTRLRV
jgi:hypothetical protein